MDLGLAGKTVIVTGGASNIGRGIVLGFAREKARIVNADIDVPQGRRWYCVAPGWIVPDSPEDTGAGSFWNRWGYEFFTAEKLELFKSGWPVPRLGKPEDIAHSVLWFASEQADFLTGQTISVSGGATMW